MGMMRDPINSQWDDTPLEKHVHCKEGGLLLAAMLHDHIWGLHSEKTIIKRYLKSQR